MFAPATLNPRLCSAPPALTLTFPHLILFFIFIWPPSVFFNFCPVINRLCGTPSLSSPQSEFKSGGLLVSDQSNTHTQPVFLEGRKQRYYGVKTDGRHFSSSSQLPDLTSGPRELPEGKVYVSERNVRIKHVHVQRVEVGSLRCRL